MAGLRSTLLPLESIDLHIIGPVTLHIRRQSGPIFRASLTTEELVFETLTGEGFSRTSLSTLPRRALDLAMDEKGAVLSVSGLGALSRDSVMGVPMDRLLRVLFPRLPSSGLSSTGTWTEARDVIFPLPAGEIELRLKENGRRASLSPDGQSLLAADFDLAPPDVGPAGSLRPRLSGRGAGSSSLRVSAGSGLFSEYRLHLRFDGFLDFRFQGIRPPAVPFSFEAISSLDLISVCPSRREDPS